jgi:hypothetical protein
MLVGAITVCIWAGCIPPYAVVGGIVENDMFYKE